MSKGRKMALIGAIIMSVSQFIGFFASAVFLSALTAAATGDGSPFIGMIFGTLFGLIELGFVWVAFVRLNKERGWRIYLLVIGILAGVGAASGLLGGLILGLISGVPDFGNVGYAFAGYGVYSVFAALMSAAVAVFFILAFTFSKKKETSK